MSVNTRNNIVLVVDDSEKIRQVICFALKKAGYETIEAADGAEALKRFSENSPSLLVLDIIMPEINGTDVCKEIRKTSNVPILFLSSQNDELDKILGLELGGDDYITKPFSPRELVARVKAVMRRLEPQVGSSHTKENHNLSHGKLSLDMESYTVRWDDHSVILTATEFNLLKAFLSFPGKVYSRDNLMDQAYDTGTVVSDRTIDSHLRRIRKKFSEFGVEPIETVHGVGYKLGPCE